MAIELDLNNPEDLHKAFDTLSIGGDLPGDSGDIEVGSTTTSESASQGQNNDQTTQAKAQVADQSQTNTEADAEGVATKDGKHVIPFSVLEAARTRATRAEQLLKDAQDREDALKAQLAGSQGAKPGESARTDGQQQAEDLSPEDLASLKEDFPTVYKALMATQQRAAAVEAQLKPVAERVQTDVARQAQSEVESVQQAIDSIPKLAHIQAQGEDAWNMAKQFDATLRVQKAWADKPVAERFQKVTEMVESAIGQIDVPGQKPSLSPQELTAAAKAVAAKTTAKGAAAPLSLSEFPAGKAPAQDEAQALGEMTHQQISEKLAGMSPEAMDAYFASL